jgi:hypothetical protein
MIGSTGNRASRRKYGRAKKMALAGATAAAITVGMATAPVAQAIEIDVDREYTWDPVYGSGLIVGLLDFVSRVAPGVDAQLSDTISFQTGPPPSLGLSVKTTISQNVLVVTIDANVTVELNLNIRQIAGDTKNLYNTEAGIPQPGCNQPYGTKAASLNVGPQGYASTCRYAIQLATLGTVGNLIDAYRAMIASVLGDTEAGLIPFTYGPNATPTFSGSVPGANGPAYTNQALLLLQNHLRPNGGIAARFPGFTSLLGGDPEMPKAGKTVSPDGKIVLNTTTLDLTWAYDPIADFPAVFNVVSIANSLAGLVPLNIVNGGLAPEQLQGSSLAEIGTNLAGLLQLPIDVQVPISIVTGTLFTLAMEDGKAFYSTLVPNELPITTAIGLPGILANFALDALGSPFLIGNPIGDALAPALRILTNIGYTDVLSPDDLNFCATGCGTADAKTWAQLGYSAYDRTFGAYAAPDSVENAATPVRFGSVETLTREENSQVFGDVFTALLEGTKAQLSKPFWGIIEPANTASSTAAVKASPAVAPAATTPVAEIPAADVESVAAPVSEPQVPAAPAAPEAAPEAPEAPETPATPASDAPDPAEADLADAAVEDAPATASRAGRGVASKVGAPTRGRAASADSDSAAKPSASTGGRQSASS